MKIPRQLRERSKARRKPVPSERIELTEATFVKTQAILDEILGRGV